MKTTLKTTLIVLATTFIVPAEAWCSVAAVATLESPDSVLRLWSLGNTTVRIDTSGATFEAFTDQGDGGDAASFITSTTRICEDRNCNSVLATGFVSVFSAGGIPDIEVTPARSLSFDVSFSAPVFLVNSLVAGASAQVIGPADQASASASITRDANIFFNDGEDDLLITSVAVDTGLSVNVIGEDPPLATGRALASLGTDPIPDVTLIETTDVRKTGGVSIPPPGVLVASLVSGESFSSESSIRLEAEVSTIIVPTCDFDGNGACEIDDIDALVMEIVAGTNTPSFDLNGDGLVDLLDRDDWLAQAGAINLVSGNPYLVGDSNLDGRVDGMDYIDWNANKFASSGKWSLADWNADGITDGLDFVEWNSNKFMSAEGGAAVPEPSTATWLMITMLLSAGIGRRAHR